MYDKERFKKEGLKKMNFNNPKTKRIIAIVIMVVIVAMVGTSVLPYVL